VHFQAQLGLIKKIFYPNQAIKTSEKRHKDPLGVFDSKQARQGSVKAAHLIYKDPTSQNLGAFLELGPSRSKLW